MSLTIEVYSSGSTVLLPDDYRNASEIRYSGYYPGGLYGDASFFVPREPARLGLIVPGMRVKIRSGNVTVWEGYVSARELVNEAQRAGVRYTCLGAWGYVLDGVRIRKPWADTRMSEDAWASPLTAAASNDKSLLEWASLDRNNRLRFTPRSTRDAAGAETGWAQNDYVRVVYTAPTGQTIKRITLSYDLQESTQNWKIAIYDPTAATDIGTGVTSSGTGTKDETLGTPRQTIWLYMQCGTVGGATPPSDGTVYGEFSNVVVYTETGAIDSTEIGKDVLPFITACSTAETGIGSNTLSLVPFVADNISAAETLFNAANYGDASFNAWAFYMAESDLSPDDKPILYYAQQPALTDAEYYIRLDDANIQPPANLVQDTAEVRNYITVRYRDTNGRDVFVTPADDANLTDAASVALYGTRAEELTIDTTSTTLATNYGRRYLASRKDPQWTIPGGLTVKGFIRNATNGNVPAANIKPGQRVRVENFVEDISGTGLTYLITGTDYDDTSETNALQVGRPNSLEVWLARMTGGIR